MHLKRSVMTAVAGLMLSGCAWESRPALEQPAAVLLDALRFESISEGLPRSGLWVGAVSVLPNGLNGDASPTLLSTPARKSGGAPAVFSLDSDEGWQLVPCKFPARPYDYGPALADDLNGDGLAELALGAHLRGIAVVKQVQDNANCLWSSMDQGLPTGAGGAPGLSVGALAVTRESDGTPWLWVLPDIPSARGDIRGLRAYQYNDKAWRRLSLNEVVNTKIGAGLAAGHWGQKQWLLIASRMINDRSVLLTQNQGEWSLAKITGWPSSDHLFHSAVSARRLNNGRDAPLMSYRYAREGEWYRRLVQLKLDQNGVWQQQIISETVTRTPISAIAGARLPGAGFGADIVAATRQGDWYVYRETATGFEQRTEPAAAWRKGCQPQSITAQDILGDSHDELIVNYATEPPAYDFDKPCPSLGGIEVWRILE